MNLRHLSVAILCASCHSLLWAAPPDAGSLQQQFRQQQPQLPKQREMPAPKEADKLPGSGPTLVVKAFRFEGNTLVTSEKLAALLDGYLSRPLTFNDLQFAAAEIGELYRQEGWVARVYVPEQEVVDGVVTLQVIEGRFGKWRLDGNEPERFDTTRVSGYIDAVQPAGEILNVKSLDRALLLLDDLPGVNVVGNLASGQGDAETDLVLQMGDESFVDGQVSLDNYGSRSTGAERLNGELYVKSPFKLGDQLRGYLSHSKGNDYIWFNYSMPFGFDGLRVGANASYLEYDVITSEFKAADLDGESATWGLDANYPVIRERTRNLYLGLAYENKQFENRSLSSITSDYEVDNFRFSLTGNLFDSYGGGGANFINLGLTSGDVDLGALDPSENADIDGRFTKLGYLLSRQQVITSDLSFFGSISGQFADGNLDSSEKFYLGGPYGVRAYPVNEGGGDEAVLAKMELRYRASNTVVLTGFYDWGEVQQNKKNDVLVANPNTYILKGAGLALSWNGPHGITFEGTYARRIGDNPNPQANGNDQDGSLDKDRLWFTVSVPF